MSAGKTIQDRRFAVKFVTFNIRLDWEGDGENRFENRKPLILRTLEEERPDFVCFQEVLPHMFVWLRESLAGYDVIGCGRDPALSGEAVAIAFRRDRWSLIGMDTYWLSPTPREPGSRYPEQSDCPRVCTEALFNELGTPRALRVVNTHLDHRGVQARALGLAQMLRHIDAAALLPDAPVVLTGDFNAEPGSPEMRAFDDFPGYANATEDIGITYHGYMKAPGESIDYIFLRGGIACRGVRRWEHTDGPVFLSDHYPVCAELEWV